MGSLGDDQFEAYTAVFYHGPGTAKEIRKHVQSCYRDGFHKRLSELRRKGHIKETGVRKCKVTGRAAIVWDVVGCGCGEKK